MAAPAVPIVVAPAEISDDSLPSFEGRLEPILKAGGPGVVLDMADVKFLGSSGLGYLVKSGMALDRAQRRIALARCPRDILKLIRLTGLESLLPHFKTVPDAERYVVESGPKAT